MNHLTLTKSKGKIYLDAYQGENHLGRLRVTTGLQTKQHANNFRTKPKERVMQGEPVPEARYSLSGLYWAGGEGNYTKLYPQVLSPIWVTIDSGRKIGFHLDANAPGTLGCVGFLNMDDLKTFVGWYLGYGDFKYLYVNWGLGHVKMPKSKPSNKNYMTVSVNGTSIEHAVEVQDGKTVYSPADMLKLGISKKITVEKMKKAGLISDFDFIKETNSVKIQK